MKPPEFPLDEEQRLESLTSMRLLDTPVEERFERITRLAQKFFGVAMSAITLVDAERQWFKSSHGLALRQTSRESSFCGHAILGDDVLVVEDTHEDKRFYDNPLVTGEPYIRFYAGAPIRASDRSRIGTLCILDHAPHITTNYDFSVLKDLAALAEREFRFESPLNLSPPIDVQYGANPQLLDEVTGLWNWDGITRLLEESSHRLRLIGGEEITPVWLHVDYTLPVNPSSEAINDAERKLTACILAALDFRDTAGYVTGGQFLLLLDGADQSTLITRLGLIANRIQALFQAPDIQATLHHIRLSARYGASVGVAIAELLDQLEARLPDYDTPLGTLNLDTNGDSNCIHLIEHR